jgi:CRP-like cAMP-binding protein
MTEVITSIPKLVVLKCTPTVHARIAEYSDKTGISMKRIVEDMVDDWLRTVGKARLEALDKLGGVSQNENLA